jgi:hypothetical protein
VNADSGSAGRHKHPALGANPSPHISVPQTHSACVTAAGNIAPILPERGHFTAFLNAGFIGLHFHK